MKESSGSLNILAGNYFYWMLL